MYTFDALAQLKTAVENITDPHAKKAFAEVIKALAGLESKIQRYEKNFQDHKNKTFAHHGH